MPFMFCDHAGTIRIGNYTPTSAYPIARGKEAALWRALADDMDQLAGLPACNCERRG